ncbi:hypothetical protein IWW54_002679, partial [Coemansia sp. RSA 2705]
MLPRSSVRAAFARVSRHTPGSQSIRHLSSSTVRLSQPGAHTEPALASPRLRTGRSTTRILNTPQYKPSLPADPEFTLGDRTQALCRLSEYVDELDALGAYQHVYQMRQDGLLAADGQETRRVLLDREVALDLARLVGSHYNWSECLDVLNLLLEIRGDPNASKTQPATQQAGSQSADPHVLRALLQAVLSPRFAGLPERRLAGLTALQMIADYDMLRTGPDYLASNIRTCGFVSNKHSLQRLVSRISQKSLSRSEKFELALAHARCLQPDECVDLLAAIPDLTPEQSIEIRMALCAAYAEKAQYNQALQQLEQLEYGALWKDVQTFDKQATVFHSRINAVHATALALTPRQPFTYYYHTLASAHCSPRFTDRQPNVPELFDALAASVRTDVAPERRRRLGLSSSLYHCGCAVYTMCAASGRHAKLSLADLRTQLHGQQQDLVHRVTAQRHSTVTGLDHAAALLRSYLWALVFTLRMDATKRNRLAWDELVHAESYVPGFKMSAMVLEPALVLMIPRSVWTAAQHGGFKGNSAFMLADDALNSVHNQPTYGHGLRLAKLAAAASTDCDHRLYPLRIFLAMTQGQDAHALTIAQESLTSPQMRVSPGTLALENGRTTRFFEQLTLSLSMFRQGADLAVTQVRMLLQSQFRDISLTERIAACLLYCCVRARSEPVAHSILEGLERQGIALTPRIQELYMRTCVRAGQMPRALALFHRLHFEGRATLVSEPTFACFIDYTAEQRESLVGAEHAFDAWLRIADFQGRVTATLVRRWEELGMTRESKATANAFLPKVPLDEALESAGVK